jgi:hypothetical protein
MNHRRIIRTHRYNAAMKHSYIHKSSAAYRHDGRHYLVGLNLRDTRQLFNSLDPAPFRERDLDSAAEDYIVDAVREIGHAYESRMVIHVPPEGMNNETEASLVSAIRHYFEYRAQHAADDLKQSLLRGGVGLLIGLTFLFACLWVRSIVDEVASRASREILSEGLLILGWVAMWRPIDTFLYDWWPIRHRQNLLRRILVMPIEMRAKTDRL